MPAPAPEASSAAAPRPARIERPPSPFDCAHSSRASHQPEDFDGLTRTARRARVPNRHGVSAIEHPTDTALTSSVRSVDRDGRKTWPMDSDAVEGRRGSAWLTVAVEKPRRTIGTIRDALAGAGFTIRHGRVRTPISERIAADPYLAKGRARSMRPIIEAQSWQSRISGPAPSEAASRARCSMQGMQVPRVEGRHADRAGPGGAGRS